MSVREKCDEKSWVERGGSGASQIPTLNFAKNAEFRMAHPAWRARLSSTIQDTKRYVEDFDRLQKTAKSDQELFDQMTELYPHWVANQSWLMFGFPQP
jgi:hypothetical protein